MDISGRSCRRLMVIGSTGALLLLVVEAGLRWSGITDFPLYDVDPDIGYVLRPHQSGTFLNRNEWTINEWSMAAGPFRPHAAGRGDIVLVGDSIVWGGNALAHDERLGPCLAAAAPSYAVWPACAGSWSALNEITWMQRHADVMKEATHVVWVLNTGDFAYRSQWSSDRTHPRSHPWSSTWYCLDKYLLSRLIPDPYPGAATPMPPDGLVEPAIVQDIVSFLNGIQSRCPSLAVILVLYPNKEQIREPPDNRSPYSFASVYRAVASIPASVNPALDRIRLLDGRNIPGWGPASYRDDIHPNPEGNRLLAQWIARRLP